MGNKVVVLGAGIAGLTVAISLLQKGYDVTLIEKNEEVGDACLHWVMGTNKKSSLYKEWKNIGAFEKDIPIISLPTLGSFECQGTTVTFYRNLNKTEKELIKISPEDKKAIHKFINSVRDMGSIMGMVLKNKKLTTKEVLHRLPNFRHIIKSMRESRETYAERFKHPAIKFAIKNAQTGYNNMFFFLDLYGIFSTGNADIPEGGAYYMIQRIKNRFLSLGGKIVLNTEINGLLLEKNRIFAAKSKENVFEADYFISTVDPHYTLEKLLNNQYQIKLFDKLESTIEKRSVSSCFNVYIAVDGDVSHIDVPTILNIPSIRVGTHDFDSLLVRPYYYDTKHFINNGKTVVSLFVDQNQDDFNYYKSLTEKDYKNVKKQITNFIIDSFINRYPEFNGKIEILSSFGPLELNKRVNTSYGSIQSYSFTDESMFYAYKGTIKEIKNLYFCGQWCRAIGGTPTALLTAIEISKKFDDISDK